MVTLVCSIDGEDIPTEAPDLPPSPVLLHPILKSQTLILEPTIPEGIYAIYCRLENHYDPMQSVEYLKQLMLSYITRTKSLL